MRVHTDIKAIGTLALFLFITARIIPCLAYSTADKSFSLELEFSFPSLSQEEDVYLYGASFISEDLLGNFFVSDWKANTVFKFDPLGKFLGKFGKTGQGPGEFQRPCMVLFTQENILVYDNGNHRIQFFDNNNNFVKSIKLYKGYKDMVISDQGLIYAAPVHISKKAPLIDVLTLNGELLTSFGEPKQFKTEWIQLNDVRLAINNKDELYVAFKYCPIIRKYSNKGMLISEFSVGNKEIEMRGNENIKKGMKMSTGNISFWLLANDIEATKEGFCILNCYPNILILEYDANGKLNTTFNYQCKNEDYYSADFSIKENRNSRNFYVLQFMPMNIVDVFNYKERR